MADTLKTEITTRFFKTHDYRTIIIDGVIGGFNNSGKLNMNFYIDSIAVPEKLTLVVDTETNKLISNQTVVGIDSNEAIKEIPLTVSMNYELSKQVLIWLTDQIKNFEKANPLIVKK